VDDDTISGQPSSSRNENNVVRIRDMKREDRTLTVRMLSDALHINKSNCHQILLDLGKRLGILGSLLNRSGLSIRNGVLLYKQLIRPMMDYACPVWSSASSHIKKLQVLHSKCLRIANNAPWYICNRQIHDDLGVPYFSDHITSMSDSTRS
jgi:hypothetical protein